MTKTVNSQNTKAEILEALKELKSENYVLEAEVELRIKNSEL